MHARNDSGERPVEGAQRSRRRPSRSLLWWLNPLASCLLALLMAGAGCAENAKLRRGIAKPYRPENTHQGIQNLPSDLRRVAVLPVTFDASDPAAESGVANLEPILLSELRRRATFEVIPISRDQLRTWSGGSGWRQEEPLPPNLFGRIREHTGADAILFSHLTVYRAYPPLAVGWRLALVDPTRNAIHWSVDEVFDAGSTEVIKSAQAYARAQMNQPSTELDSTAVLGSPRRFGQYAAAAALGTMPGR